MKASSGDALNCLDTYVLVEISKANPLFSRLMNAPFLIPDTTMAEFYGIILREFDERTAEYWLRKFVFYCKPVGLETLIRAVTFRRENRKSNFSFFDAVGYAFSLESKCDFVTGDISFKGMKNALFVK